MNYDFYQSKEEKTTNKITNEQQTDNKPITNEQQQYNKDNKYNKDKKDNNSCCNKKTKLNTDNLQDIIDFYNNNIGLITPYTLEILSDYAKDMENDVIIYAMKRAVESNARNINFIKTVLNNWYKSGVKTLIQAQEENQHFKNKNKPIEETEEEKRARKLKELEEATKDDPK